MILVTIKIDARSSKQKELTQTVNALAERVRQEAGCVSSQLYRDVKNENELCLLEEWATEADLDEHLRSQNFGVLRGAVKALGAQTEMRFHTVSQTRGEEVIEQAREHGARG
jgi:quinol monooxygenase YgiN